MSLSPVIDDAAVLAYLSAHPEFFDLHPQALPLSADDNQQVLSLSRFKAQKLEQALLQAQAGLKDFVGIGQLNDQLADLLHRLTVQWLGIRGTLSALLMALDSSLKENFSPFGVQLFLEAAPAPYTLKDPALSSWWCGLKTPYCGIPPAVLTPYLPNQTGSIVAISLMPHAVGGVLWSTEHAERFSPQMDTLYLARAVEIAAILIAQRG